MKKSFTISTLIAVLFFSALSVISYNAITSASGPIAAVTGAPSELNCTQSGCHVGTAITSGTNWNTIALNSTIPAGGYVPGTTYSMTLTMTQSGIVKFGFQASVLNSSNTQAGSFVAGASTFIQSSGGRSYINHSASGTSFPSNTASWTFSWVAPNPGSGTITFYVAVNATNNDANTTGDQINLKSFAFSQAAAGSPPTAVITATPTTVCVGDTVTFQGSGANSPTGFAWQFGINGSPSSSTQQNVKVVYTAAGSFNAVLNTSNAFGSSGLTPKAITVLAKPSATVTSSSTGTVLCGSNDSIVLSAPSGTGLTYLWSPGNEATRSITVKTPGTYSVKVTNASNCSATSANTVITQNTIPVVTLTASADTACQTDTLHFMASGSFPQYKFFIDGVLAYTGPNATLEGGGFSSSNVFTVVVTDAGGCKSLPSNPKSVVIKTPLPAPVIACGTSTSSSVQFTWAAVTNATGYEVSTDAHTWTAPSSGSTGLSHTVAGLAGGTLVNLFVRATSTGACAHGLVAVQTCQTVGCPKVTFTYTGAKRTCLASDAALGTALASITNVNAVKYSVNINNLGYTGSNSAMVNLMKGVNNIHIRILDSLNMGCPQTDSVIAITGVNSPDAKPVLSFDASSADTAKAFCEGTPVLIFSSKPAGAHRYLFISNFTDTIQAGFLSAYSGAGALKQYRNNDLATVIAVDTVFGCNKVSDPVHVRINAVPKAGFTYAATGLNVNFTDTSKGHIRSWAWVFGNGTAGSALKSPVNVYPASGNYTVALQVTDSNGCKDSTTRQITLTNTGISELAVVNDLKVYPNPAGQLLNVSCELNQPSAIGISIYDMNGREVHSVPAGREISGWYEETISLEELPAGMYMMLIRTNTEQHLARFGKQ